MPAVQGNIDTTLPTDNWDEAIEAETTQPADYDWTLGNFKPATKWANQMKERDCTLDQINDVIANGEQMEAPNYVYKGNGATRYEDVATGRFIVKDNVNNKILQISGKNFIPSK